MGNRSKFVAGTGIVTAAGIVAARRRARLRSAAFGIGTAIEPTIRPPSLDEEVGPTSEGLAPGHRHVRHEDAHAIASSRLRRRPWSLHGGKIRHPYAPD